ncbi:protein CREG1 [Onthophagus taurus]|uniref:protein CREG1 n=1 Tax=Onthophagus taurus TaxID=166361 RepID=UPI000C1FDD68|nr:protein CREG1-like [Onthophagus taurus]XP_022909089.1 protein CREG1-like [Onthophagus taurus]
MIQKFFSVVFVLILCLFGTNAKLFDPPDHDKIAAMARYIMKNSDWVSLATISTQKNIVGFPFVTLKSISDGTRSNSTGVPYLYMTDMDLSGQDILKDNRVTIMCSLAEGNYCERNDYDPQDPRCAKLMITGRMIKPKSGSDDYNFGLESLTYKHPAIKYWPTDHGFYVAKIDIDQIGVLDFFGGIKYITPEEYFKVDLVHDRFFHYFFEKIGVFNYNS